MTSVTVRKVYPRDIRPGSFPCRRILSLCPFEKWTLSSPESMIEKAERKFQTVTKKETPMIRIYLYERPLGAADFLKERGLEGNIKKGPAGKPFLPGSGHYFNKSDSGAFTAFALSDEGEVGLDLQKILPYKDRYLRLSERFFCPEEKNALLSLKEEERGDYFFRLWTVKESYLKFTGKGLGGGLDSFGTDLGSGRILPGRDQDPPAVFRILEGPGGYALSVCASSLPDHIEIIREA